MGASPDKGFSGGGAQGRDVEKAAHAQAQYKGEKQEIGRQGRGEVEHRGSLLFLAERQGCGSVGKGPEAEPLAPASAGEYIATHQCIDSNIIRQHCWNRKNNDNLYLSP